MNTPQLEDRPPDATSPATTAPEASAQTPTQTPVAALANQEPQEPMVDTSSRAVTAEESLAEWWSKQHGFRAVVNQLIVALFVVLIILPLASLAGWFGLRTAAPSNTTTTTNMAQTSMSNSPSPNAPAHTLYNPAAPVAASGNVVDVHLVAKETRISIASGIA